MPDLLARAFPAPIDWQAFERLCHDLFRRIWKNPYAQMHGRRGQAQAGVDVYGDDHSTSRHTGVQCKGKDEGYGKLLTIQELRDEVDKAKKFLPPLEHFILATTSPNDAVIQAEARTISKSHLEKGLFLVTVLGWDDLKGLVTDYPDLVAKFYADLAPVDTLAEIQYMGKEGTEQNAEMLAALADIKATLQARLPASTQLVLEDVHDTDPVDIEARTLGRLIDSGRVNAALLELDRLKQEKWDVAS